MNSKNILSRITIDLPIDMQKKLKALAAMHSKSMRTVVIESIEKQIKILEAQIDKSFFKQED